MFKKKRLLLVFPIIFIVMENNIILFYRNIIYITITAFFSIIILFYNFPILVNILHTTPIYYEDIELIEHRIEILDTNSFDSNISTNTTIKLMDKKKLQNIFCLINGTTGAFFIVIIINYTYHGFKDSNLKFIEIVGIIGGLINIYFKFQTYLGKCVLSILFFIKKKNYQNLNNDGIEMIELKHSSSQVDYSDIVSNETFITTKHNLINSIDDIWFTKKPNIIMSSPTQSSPRNNIVLKKDSNMFTDPGINYYIEDIKINTRHNKLCSCPYC